MNTLFTLFFLVAALSLDFLALTFAVDCPAEINTLAGTIWMLANAMACWMVCLRQDKK